MLTLDVQDVMNMYIEDIRGDVDMRWLRSDGTVIGSSPMIDYLRSSNKEFIDKLQKQLEA